MLDLLAAGAVQVDYLKVGPWIGHDRMFRLADNMPTLLHCNDSIIDAHFDVPRLATLAYKTHSPWLSVHVGLPYPKLDALWQRLAIPIPIISRKTACQRAILNLKRLRQALAIPILIENQAHYRPSGHRYLVEPTFIRTILDVTGADLLLDVGHAGVVAAMLGDADYINKLPLDRVRELHVHRPGVHKGYLRDLHLPLGPPELLHIRQLLPQCPQLKAITLEYYGPAPNLQQQLLVLRTLLDDYSAVPTTTGSL